MSHKVRKTACSTSRRGASPGRRRPRPAAPSGRARLAGSARPPAAAPAAAAPMHPLPATSEHHLRWHIGAGKRPAGISGVIG